MSLAGKVKYISHKSSATHSYQCVQYFCVQAMVWLPVFGIFDMHTDVDVCNCTQGLYGHHSESALEVDSGRKIPCCIEDLSPCEYCAWLFSRTLYQLNYPQHYT